jgi:hypothetical protein
MDHNSVMVGPKWVRYADTHFKYAHAVTKDLAGHMTEIVTRCTGWAVQQSLSGGWWALHDTDPDVGPFRTNEEAKAYVEATYALEY